MLLQINDVAPESTKVLARELREATGAIEFDDRRRSQREGAGDTVKH